MTFIQLIEYKTHRIEEINAALDEWRAQTEGATTATRGTQGHDRDHGDTYFSIVEFPSYEEAMKNSDKPETSAFAARLAALCDAPPVFHNLDVTRVEQMS